MNVTPNLNTIVSLLSDNYRERSLGNKQDPIDELVFLLLSEKTNYTNLARAWASLKSTYPKWDCVLEASDTEIVSSIAYAGMGRRRAALLRRLISKLREQYGSISLPDFSTYLTSDAEEELCKLPGIGKKTARCVLLYCYDKQTLPVDIHTYRLSQRLGLIDRTVAYDMAYANLDRIVSPDLCLKFHVNAVWHGRARCFASKPNCIDCFLEIYCSHPRACMPVNIATRPKPLAIDLFSGAGGLSEGFRNAGFQIVQAIELNKNAGKTFALNHPKVDLLENDIQSIDPVTSLTRLGLRPGDVSILMAGPPCQGFSESNRRTRDMNNPKNSLYESFIRFLSVIKPRWFLIENVSGLKTIQSGNVLQTIIGECEQIGYTVKCSQLNAAHFGVPQNRNRLFIVGNRTGQDIVFPKPTHGEGLLPFETVRGAIADLPHLKTGANDDFVEYRKMTNLTPYQEMMRTDNGFQVQGNLVSKNAKTVVERYKHIHQGENWSAIPEELMGTYSDSSRCHTGIYLRLKYNEPAKVIGNFRKNMLIHPTQNRGLSVREAARLQSFPDNYIFFGSIGFQQQQVADAVPPMLARSVAMEIAKSDRSRAFVAPNLDNPAIDR